MPAFRSEAEGLVRSAVVERLRSIRPGSRIIHEVNVSGQGSNRIDVLAVGEAEIIAVEIKSERDKLDRLPKQVEAMQGVAHHTIVALHERFLVEQETNKWAAHYERGGLFYRRDLPPMFKDRPVRGVQTWVFPERKRREIEDRYDEFYPWASPHSHLQTAVPHDALWMLWRDELYDLCAALRILVGRRATMSEMARALRWHANGAELTVGICAALRARRCLEADPEIVRAA